MGNKWGIIWFIKSPSSKSLLSLFVSCRTVIVTNVVYRTVIKRAVYFLLIQVVYFSLDSGLGVLCGSVLYKCRFYSHNYNHWATSTEYCCCGI